MLSSRKKSSQQLGAILLFLGFFLFSLGAPRNTRATTPQELTARIQALLEQVAQLQQLLKEREAGIAGGTPELSTSQSFQFDLWYGLMNNSEVRRLQEFLITKGYLASDLNTGNYLSRTEAAIKNYQIQRGIETTGIFNGPTRAAVNTELFAYQSAGQPIAPAPTLAPVAATEDAPVLLREDEAYKIYAKPNYDLLGAERKIQDIVNEERIAAGLSPLSWNDGLARVARLHSEEQVRDNGTTTTTKKPCSYPYIRHEGFTRGFGVGDRLKTAGIAYRVAGENIAAFSISKNFIYKFNAAEGPIGCPDFPTYSPVSAGETAEQARARIQKDITALIALITPIRDVTWVNKEWLTANEVAREIVTGWMNSEGHRKNILDARFLEGGIGIAEVNDYFIATHVLLRGW